MNIQKKPLKPNAKISVSIFRPNYLYSPEIIPLCKIIAIKNGKIQILNKYFQWHDIALIYKGSFALNTAKFSKVQQFSLFLLRNFRVTHQLYFPNANLSNSVAGLSNVIHIRYIVAAASGTQENCCHSDNFWAKGMIYDLTFGRGVARILFRGQNMLSGRFRRKNFENLQKISIICKGFL